MKRGMTAQTLGFLFIAIVSFLVVWLVIDVIESKAEGRTAEELCRLSIFTREKSGIDLPVLPEKEIAPLICPTEKSEDIGEGMTKEQLKEYIAYKIARCWYRYYEGNVVDVFKGSALDDTRCQICQPFNVKKWKDYEEKGIITNEELVGYLFSNTYKVVEDSDNCKLFGGKCLTNEECEAKEGNFRIEEDSKCKKDDKICCYHPYDCWNKGGICQEEKPSEGVYLEYDWKCDSGKCWIKNENYYTYLEYVQSYGGPGVVAVLTQDIHPGESYAISFGSPTKGCGLLCLQWAKPGLAVTGIGIIITAAGVLTLNPAIVVAGAKVTVVGAAATGVGAGAAGLTTAVYNAIKERKVNTIYLSTLNDATHDEICEVVE